MSPKPPRAHHCRICDKCILKMDHHCRIPPSHTTHTTHTHTHTQHTHTHTHTHTHLDWCPAWMFNCVGHLNHRYFFSFVVFMWLGTSYVIHCAWARVFVLMNVTNVSPTHTVSLSLSLSVQHTYCLSLQPTIHSVIDTLWMVRSSLCPIFHTHTLSSHTGRECVTSERVTPQLSLGEFSCIDCVLCVCGSYCCPHHPGGMASLPGLLQ